MTSILDDASFGTTSPVDSPSILDTVKDVVAIGAQGASAYASIEQARRRPTPATTSGNQSNGSAGTKSQASGSVLPVVLIGAVVLFAGFLFVRYAMK